MAVSRGQGSGQARALDTLVRMSRARHATAVAPAAAATTVRVPLPDGMTAPLGCDAVAVPIRIARLVAPRLPRVGCVYADGTHWWWILPSDSDYALRWPAPSHYASGALLPAGARLIHRPEGTLPYTPPIPLYLALCRITGAPPNWAGQRSTPNGV
ncbi:hypothetical protein [Streptomyces sp. V3I7]|uniref:hypothetical protein n=1 Tax=Streptomyces sp. V3I7 TaxID=3042278 RepID=UPI00277E696F|nr:hypothetical protein [Streptomyces sp. V3I7]MDQ0990280.1 hypothetical protein [Streptomyces sp. V3I7]